MVCKERARLALFVRDLSSELMLTLAFERRYASADDIAGGKAFEPSVAAVMSQYRDAVGELKQHLDTHQCGEDGAAHGSAAAWQGG